MLGKRRNRCSNGFVECPYGCCGTHERMTKRSIRRLVRRREERKWRKDEGV